MSRLVTFLEQLATDSATSRVTPNPGKSCTGCREHPLFGFQKGGNANES